MSDLLDPAERERLRAERRKGCCGDEAWRGRPCPYHEGFEDGEDSALDLIENLIAERDGARAAVKVLQANHRALSSPEHEEGPEFGPGTDLYPTRPVVAPTDTPIEAPPALRPSSPEHEESR